METNVFSLSQLLWQIINLLVLIVVFAYLGIRLVRAIRKQLPASQRTEESPKSLGELIRYHRTKCHMTQEFIAESLGVSRQAVSKWESGASEPSTGNLLALAKVFNVEAAELLKHLKR